MAKKKLLAAATLATVTAAGVGTAASAMASGTDAPSATAPSSGSTGTDSAKPADGKGRHEHTTVTGTEADKVKAAVTAKFAGVTVERVLKDPDGSYDVMGTKSGNRVGYEVSKDLKTVTERTGAPGRDGKGAGNGDGRGHGMGSGESGQSGSASAAPSGSASA